ncbi:hypothetical protein CVT24_006109 [Panaeolus cyanescens]|uniref:Ima1 N-terminal domain-containing protein n=1 Tax=Panaeolus cyanescens TaxID=181874 RepID=A0A409V8T3_9AGAR|nr:hypothetical protein CVT24_006109 [Panaeolus cyanescens]
MSKLFRRHSNLQCFFCQSSVSFPLNVRDFKCPECSCWNRYDSKGEIISDEPAMHDEAMNYLSFAKRGSLYCCSIMASPEYQTRLDMLPTYRESLHLRYPPVCDACLPQVEEEIQRKDKMARIKALGTSLNKSKERQRRISTTDLEREKHLHDRLFWWRVRGLLWGLSYVLSIFFNVLILRDITTFSSIQLFHPLLPIFNAISLLWVAWDPTYASLQKAQLQGRDLRQQGKKIYIVGPFLSIINHPQVTTLIASFFILRVQHPPSIRLVDTHSHLDNKSRRSTTPNSQGSRVRSPTPHLPRSPTLPEHDALATLSLSSKPVIAHVNPIFGVPSMKPVTPPTTSEPGEDEMDWTPTNPGGASYSTRRSHHNSDGDSSPLLRPQRFFAPEQPTGLEHLFESSARIQDENVSSSSHQRRFGTQTGKWGYSRWTLLCTAIIALLSIALLYFSKWLGLKIQL